MYCGEDHRPPDDYFVMKPEDRPAATAFLVKIGFCLFSLAVAIVSLHAYYSLTAGK